MHSAFVYNILINIYVTSQFYQYNVTVHLFSLKISSWMPCKHNWWCWRWDIVSKLNKLGSWFIISAEDHELATVCLLRSSLVSSCIFRSHHHALSPAICILTLHQMTAHLVWLDSVEAWLAIKCYYELFYCSICYSAHQNVPEIAVSWWATRSYLVHDFGISCTNIGCWMMCFVPPAHSSLFGFHVMFPCTCMTALSSHFRFLTV